LNKNHIRALIAMPGKHPPSDKAGPMGIQPIEHARSAPTQMLPKMPVATGKMKQDTKAPALPEKQQTRTEAVRAVLARITRRNSLRKQRDAQKG
jgi:hypothetical protein